MTVPSHRLPTLVERLDAWLPQTQCQQCGYPRCREYAAALATGDADVNQCPPGGEVTIEALSALLQRAPKLLDPRFGRHHPRARAVIEENLCIGCRKCLDVCPVDAILGARKLMHTVIAHECTGCELCLPPCPVDCIALVPIDSPVIQEPWPEYARAETDYWRRRTEQRVQRLARIRRSRQTTTTTNPPPAPDRAQIREEIRAAVSRVRAKKQRTFGSGSSSV
ncbi:MAG: RnfABCDGE type electron transport complex subunit B [Gammaproteobacteria bacterium]|nr:RnfABCDGE type electron transport complex subunit B [Gammaproteobacteria bacterium]